MSSGANLAAVPAELPGAYLYELVVHCGRWGVAPAALLEGTGLTMAALEDPTTRLPLATCAALVERAHVLTSQPALAFSMGMQMRLSWHGFLGFAAMAASTVRAALALAEQFSLTRTSAFSLATHVEGTVASLVLEERLPPGPLREFAVITLLVGIARIANDVTGESLTGV
ncbi:MAG TPA: AraC family transcriptional regulator ligand-binding domain-containing protein, partial [Polyangiaceae bacterium]